MEGLPTSPFRTDAFNPPSIGCLYSGNTNDYGEAGLINPAPGESIVTATNIAGVAGYRISPNPGTSTRYALISGVWNPEFTGTSETNAQGGGTFYDLITRRIPEPGTQSYIRLKVISP